MFNWCKWETVQSVSQGGWGILDNYKINKCSVGRSAWSETAARNGMEVVPGITQHLKKCRELGGSSSPGWESISGAALTCQTVSIQPPSSVVCASNEAQGKITAPGVLFLMGFCISKRAALLCGNLSVCYLSDSSLMESKFLLGGNYFFVSNEEKTLNFEICSE